MSETFDLELFLAGKRLWDEGHQPTAPGTVPMTRNWNRDLTEEELEALYYYSRRPWAHDLSGGMDALAAEILRLREELEQRTYYRCPKCGDIVPRDGQLCCLCEVFHNP